MTTTATLGDKGYIWATTLTTAAVPLLSLDSGLYYQQQQRLQEPLLLLSLSSRLHGHTSNSSSGYTSHCCSRLWVLGNNTASPTTAVAAAICALGATATSPTSDHRGWEYKAGGKE